MTRPNAQSYVGSRPIICADEYYRLLQLVTNELASKEDRMSHHETVEPSFLSGGCVSPSLGTLEATLSRYSKEANYGRCILPLPPYKFHPSIYGIIIVTTYHPYNRKLFKYVRGNVV